MTEPRSGWLQPVAGIWRRDGLGPSQDGAADTTSGDEQPSDRLVLQRLRNRAIEALELLADGDAGVRSAGAPEYFNQFFDVIDDDSPWDWRNWTIFTPEEVSGLAAVHDLLLSACGATPLEVTEDELVESGWPTRLQPLAAQVLALMETRGRFSEDIEEEKPSGC